MNECNAVHRTVQVKMLTSLTGIKIIHDFTFLSNVYSTANQSSHSWRCSVRTSFWREFVDKLLAALEYVDGEQAAGVKEAWERGCWWGNDHVIWECQQTVRLALAGCLCCCPLALPGHLLRGAAMLHLNTDLRPAGSLFILIALASFAVCHWLLSLISIPHEPPHSLSLSLCLSMTSAHRHLDAVSGC